MKPGCKIVSGFDHKASDESRLGYLYVVDKNTVIHDEETKAEYPETIFYIEPAWAKDAEGKSVPTHYEINGNTITQVVEFDENTAFPVVADPAVGGYTYKKANVSYYNKWSKKKRCSDNVKAHKGEKAKSKCDRTVSFSGSVSGTIYGISTIGAGGTFSSTVGYSLSFKGPATKYLSYKALYNRNRDKKEVQYEYW